jgi:prepilin-type N-terminal cleavage/methylation domain-containing protein
MKRRRAFTLTEILVACGIVALLMAISSPLLRTAVARANESRSKEQLRQNYLSIEIYRNENDGIDSPDHPARMGYPPRTLGYKSIETLREMIHCRGVSPLGVPVYWVTYEAGLMPSPIGQQYSENFWVPLLQKMQGDAILIGDNCHQDQNPVTEFSRQKLNFVTVTGSIKTRWIIGDAYDINLWLREGATKP